MDARAGRFEIKDGVLSGPVVYMQERGNARFVVAEQQMGRYTPHLFDDRGHFAAWMKVYKPRNKFVPPFQARGRQMGAIDHRGEFDPDVDDEKAGK